MILFVYFITIAAFFGVQGAVYAKPNKKTPVGYKHWIKKSEWGRHPKSFNDHSYSLDRPDTFGAGSGTDDGVKLTSGIWGGLEKSALEYFNKGKSKVEEGLENLADTVESGGEKVVADSLDFVQKEGTKAINISVDAVGSVSKTAVKGGLTTLQFLGVNNGTINDIGNSSNDIIDGSKDLTKDITQKLVKGGTEVLNKTGVGLVRDSVGTFRDAVNGESNALQESVPDIVSGISNGNLKQVKSASINLVSNTVETGRTAFNGVADTIGHGATNLGTGAADVGIDTLENLVHIGLNKTMKVAKDQGVNEKVVDEVGGILRSATNKVGENAKVIVSKGISFGVDVVKDRYTRVANLAVDASKWGLKNVR